MGNIVSVKKTTKFTKWLILNGEVQASTKLLEAIRAKSPILGARIQHAVDASTQAWRERGVTDEKFADMRGLDIFREVMGISEKGPYEWQE